MVSLKDGTVRVATSPAVFFITAAIALFNYTRSTNIQSAIFNSKPSIFKSSIFKSSILLILPHLFTPFTSSAQQMPEHRVWISKANHGDSVTFKFWFRERNQLRFIQEGKELKEVIFEANQVRYFSFQEWDRFPMVRFCNEDGVLKMWFLTRDTFDQFECAGQEIKVEI